jgi:hypothetical protein
MTEPQPAPPPPPPPAGPAARSGTTFGVGQILALVGSAVVAISSWLDWIKGFEGFDAESAHEGPAKFLIDYTSEPGGLSIGTLLVILGIVGVVGALLAQVRVLAVIAGAGGIVVGGLFMYQIKSLVDDFDFGSFGDLVGIGAYLAVIGGALALAGGIVSLRSR